MQKYRRWTDNATGVNPFIIADKNKHNLLYNVISIIKSILLVGPFLFYLQTFIICQIIPFQALKKLSASIFLYFFMIFQTDDNNLVNNLRKLDKTKSKTQYILSNYSSPLEVFYFISRVQKCAFVVFHQYQENNQIVGQKYETISGVRLLFKTFFNRQPFYQLHDVSQRKATKYYNTLKDLSLENEGKKLVIFYEKIRTNGLATIKLGKTLAEKIYELETDYLMCRLTYTARDEIYFNMVRSPLLNWFRMLGGFKAHPLKARSQITDISYIHSPNELRNDVNEFTTNNASKLVQISYKKLETKPSDYAQFLQFYGKTQKSEYVNDLK